MPLGQVAGSVMFARRLQARTFQALQVCQHLDRLWNSGKFKCFFAPYYLRSSPSYLRLTWPSRTYTTWQTSRRRAQTLRAQHFHATTLRTCSRSFAAIPAGTGRPIRQPGCCRASFIAPPLSFLTKTGSRACPCSTLESAVLRWLADKLGQVYSTDVTAPFSEKLVMASKTPTTKARDLRSVLRHHTRRPVHCRQ